MSLQLRSISIYSHEGERRDVEFRLGSLNIVTGASKTGKSALLDIVDYCWGRAECTVAEGEIRKSVSWFLLHLDNSGEGIRDRLSEKHHHGRTKNAAVCNSRNFRESSCARARLNQVAAGSVVASRNYVLPAGPRRNCEQAIAISQARRAVHASGD